MKTLGFCFVFFVCALFCKAQIDNINVITSKGKQGLWLRKVYKEKDYLSGYYYYNDSILAKFEYYIGKTIIVKSSAFEFQLKKGDIFYFSTTDYYKSNKSDLDSKYISLFDSLYSVSKKYEKNLFNSQSEYPKKYLIISYTPLKDSVTERTFVFDKKNKLVIMAEMINNTYLIQYKYDSGYKLTLSTGNKMDKFIDCWQQKINITKTKNVITYEIINIVDE